jgi:Flp pilus assembly protein TadD
MQKMLKPTERDGHGRAAWFSQLTGDRRFGPALLVVCAIGAGLRIAILAEYLRRNPFAYSPVTDGAVYWEWAGRIARGEWIGRTPFVSAPLYPYLLGLLRYLGGELPAVYISQLILDLITVVVLAWIARERIGPGAGLLAAVAWLVLDEPAFFFTRVLNSTLQVFLVVVVWVALLRWQRHGSWRTAGVSGVLLGLNCLANPAMMVLVVLVPVWMAVSTWARGRHRLPVTQKPSGGQETRHGRSTREVDGQDARPPTIHGQDARAMTVHGQDSLGTAAQAALLAVLAIAVISPATWHNWRACREFIPITACPGITLRQGNGPGAVGTFVGIPGVSAGRDQLFEDAARVYHQATGRPVRWRDVDRYFRDQALDYLRADPVRAAGLVLRRVYWFVSGRYYCDVHQPSWERDTGLARLLWLAPLPTAWLIGPGLVGMMALLRRPLRFGPEWFLLAVPFFVVAAFQYSPRYRLPAIPVIVVAAAWAMTQLPRWRSAPRWAAATAVSAVAAVALGPINRATGFEDPARLAYSNEYNLAVALSRLGRDAEAIDHLHKALTLLPTSPDAHNDLAVLLARRGDVDTAIHHYEQALRFRPGWARAECNLGLALAGRRRFDQAIEHLSRARASRPDSAEIAYNLAVTLAASKRFEEAIHVLREELKRRPDDLSAANNLAWILATCPRGDLRNGAEAVALAERVCRGSSPEQPGFLDSLAAAYAETGRFDQAVAIAERAAELAATRKDPALADRLRLRIELYRQHRPYREGD